MNNPPRGAEARLLAFGSLAQQAAQATGLVVLLVVVTVLARRLSLSELGAYGLLATLAGYLLVLRNSVASSAVRTLAAARDDHARAGAFSTVVALYAAVGLVTGMAIAAAGLAIAGLLLPDRIADDGRLGAALLGLVMAAGLVVSAYLDALRGMRLFARAAAIEIAGMVVFGTLMIVLATSDAGLAPLVAASGSWMLVSGTLSALAVRSSGLPYRFRRREVTRARLAELLPTAGYLLVVELSMLVMYALDRVILGAFKSTSTVGLYEGPVRAHNLFYSLYGALAVTVLPTASHYAAAGDESRLRELVLRGSRYTLALYVPLVVTLMALAGPVLEVWLGQGFDEGAAAMTILLSYWLLYGALGVTPGLLVGAGRAREVALYTAGAAALNLALSLALTPALGLEGPALGTAIPFFLAFPLFLRLSLAVAPVRLGELAGTAWLPAYSLGAVLAAALVALRTATSLETLPAVAGAGLAGIALYWAAFYMLWLRSAERALVRDVARRGLRLA